MMTIQQNPVQLISRSDLLMLMKKMLIIKMSTIITLKVNWLRAKTFLKNKKEHFRVLQKRNLAKVHTKRKNSLLQSTVEIIESKLTLQKEVKVTSLSFHKNQV